MMMKMTFALAISLYAGFVIWGDPYEPMEAETAKVASASIGTSFARPVIMSSDGISGAVVTRAAVTQTVVPDAATIAASAPAPSPALEAPRLIGEPTLVSLVQPVERDIAVETNTGGLLQVSGTRVNMRAGPSTSNPVVDSLPGGTLAQPIGPEVGGWIEIRDVASGLTGFMSARFLEPA